MEWFRKRQPILHSLFDLAGRAARRSLTNLKASAIGSEATFNGDARFLRQSLLHFAGFRPMGAITCGDQGLEGATSQALTVMMAITFARSAGLRYLHTPFSRIGHSDRPMPEWVAAWEACFNLGAGEAPCPGDRREVVDLCGNLEDFAWYFDWRTRLDELAHHFRALVPEFRRRYFLNKPRGARKHLRVAVHVRRGDVTVDRPDYFTSNQEILRALSFVRAILQREGVEHSVQLHSQGRRSDLSGLEVPGVERCLNHDPISTLGELIDADVLLMAKGCFSYYAGLICDGIKIFEPRDVLYSDYWPPWKWRMKPMSDAWIPRMADGSFDAGAFERQLGRVLARN
jgi:hypothetical protein